MTSYEDIKKTSDQTPNQYVLFGRVFDEPKISVLPDPINIELARTINPKIPNKTYYADDGKYTIRIISKFIGKRIAFEYSIKCNDSSKKAKKQKTPSYEDYVENFKFYIISGVIVLASLLIFSIPILKSLL